MDLSGTPDSFCGARRSPIICHASVGRRRIVPVCKMTVPFAIEFKADVEQLHWVCVPRSTQSLIGAQRASPGVIVLDNSFGIGG